MQQSPDAQRFAWRRWGENGVVFDRQYGDTHTLMGTAAAVFDTWLAAGEAGLEALIRSAGQPSDAGSPAQTELDKALRELQQRRLLPSH